MVLKNSWTLITYNDIYSERETTMADKKTYVLLNARNKDTNHEYTNRAPSGAAKKAVNAGFGKGGKKIKLREKGTNKVFVYKGSYKLVPAPDHLQDFLGNKKVKQAKVTRVDYFRL